MAGKLIHTCPHCGMPYTYPQKCRPGFCFVYSKR